MLKRRGFLGLLGSLLAVPALSLGSVYKKLESVPDHDVRLEMVFKNGDVQNVYFKGMSVVSNSMGHHSFVTETFCDLEPMFEFGKTIDDAPIHMTYRGYDKFEQEICNVVVVSKKWVTNL